MKKSSSQAEVLVLDAEEIPLEKVIDTALVKANVTDKVISALKQKYGGMTLKSLEDKDSYLELKECKREVAKVRILAEKITKKGREESVRIQRLWLAKEKDVVGRICEVETHLASEMKKFEDEEERRETEAAKKREEAYIARQSALVKMGAGYDNGCFVLNHISYEVELIKQADEDMWNDTILPKYKREFEVIEADRVAEENRRKEEMERNRKEREEFEAKQAEFRRHKEEFQAMQAELQRQKDEIERQKREDQQKRDDEARKAKNLLVNSRSKQLRDMGMLVNGIDNTYEYKSVTVSIDRELEVYDEAQWSAMVVAVSTQLQSIKRIEEQEKAAAIEEQRQKDIATALENERQRVVEEQRLAELKKQEDAIRKSEELAQAKDSVKFQDIISRIKEVQLHEMASPVYRKKVTMIKEKLEEIYSL